VERGGLKLLATIDVAMLAFGGPGSVADVGRFIEAMTGAPPPAALLAVVVHKYEAIGDGSPLPEITARQAAALQATMVAQLGVGVRVRPGFLYSSPTVAECLAELDGGEAVVLPMSPYSSRLTTGAYRAALSAAGRDELPLLDGWHADRRYLAALSQRINETLDGADPNEFALLFTAHSVPLETIIEGDPYVEQLQQTVAQLLPALMPGDWRLAFQSKGRRGGEWLEPEVATAVRELAAAGWNKLLVVPIGFVADNVETLYDLDVELREVAASCDMDFLRSRALNDSPRFIEALADLVIDYLAHRPLTGPVDLGRGGPFGQGGPFGPDDPFGQGGGPAGA
jgi:ferrochelatase